MTDENMDNMEDRDPTPPEIPEGVPDGAIPAAQVFRVGGLALIAEVTFFGNETANPQADQVQAELADSFIFAMNGMVGAEPAQIVLSIPPEGMMFMIAQAMSRLQGQSPIAPPNVTPGGLILPGQDLPPGPFPTSPPFAPPGF